MIRRTPPPGQSQRWMVSYLDVLTILLIFFVTAAAASLKKIAASPPIAGTESKAPLLTDRPENDRVPRAVATRDDALNATGQKLKDEGLDVRELSETSSDNIADVKGLAIHLSQAVVFAPGDDRVRPEALPDLRRIAEALQDIPNKVNLAGHADTTPIHNRRFKNNWELAAARSLRLMEVLTERYGIDPARVSISSYGSLEPKGPNNTPGGRASNRRVEILIYAE